MKNRSKLAALVGSSVGVAMLSLNLTGCAAGSATAGYSLSAGSADELKSTARDKIIEDAVEQAKAYTDAEIAKLKTTR